MRTIIALAIIGYAIATQQSNAAANYCMGNNTADTNCSSCYNYGLGTIGARYLSSNVCTAKLTVITDCLRYNSTKTNTTAAVGDCELCNAKDWLNVVATAGSISNACSATAPSAASGSGQNCAAKIDNCDQTACHQNNATYTRICAQCSATYYADSATAVLGLGSAGCTASSNAIAGCSIYLPTDRSKCYLCTSGKSVKFAENLCMDFSNDTNCRQLQTGDTYCKECKTNYYFTATTCTIGYTATTAAGANLMAISALFMALLAFFN